MNAWRRCRAWWLPLRAMPHLAGEPGGACGVTTRRSARRGGAHRSSWSPSDLGISAHSARPSFAAQNCRFSKLGTVQASVIVNDWLAVAMFPSEDPIGRRIR